MTIGELKERLEEIEEKFGPYLPVRMLGNKAVNIIKVDEVGTLIRRVVKIWSA